MTECELRAAAIGIMVYEHLLQTGGGELEEGESVSEELVRLDMAADIVYEYMEAALELCSFIQIDENVRLRMEGISDEA